MNKKICNKCNKEKNIEDFPFKNKIKNIYHYVCKECWKDIRKESYNNNKEATFIRNKRNKKKSKLWYDEYKSNLKCNRCSENHIACLEFHHTDSTEKEHNVSTISYSTYSIETIKKEIEKCEVLCANCHRKHHYNENLIKINNMRNPNTS